MKEFDTKVEELRKLYKEKPTETINGINEVIFNVKFNSSNNFEGKKETEETKNSKKALISGIFAVCIFLMSVINIKCGSEQFMLYFFGAAFFLAGLFVGLNVPVFGIIFLFSHGGTGLGIMCASKIKSVLDSPLMTDNPTNLKYLLILGAGLIIAGIISTIFYNVSNKIKNQKYSLIIILSMFAVGIAIIQILPIMFNIPIN